jgi:hypothetical protein
VSTVLLGTLNRVCSSAVHTVIVPSTAELTYMSFITTQALYRREIKPPFTPEVVNEFDTKYVPKAYLQAEAKDSFEEKPKKGKDKNPVFEAFTFAGDKALDDN